MYLDQRQVPSSFACSTASSGCKGMFSPADTFVFFNYSRCHLSSFILLFFAVLAMFLGNKFWKFLRFCVIKQYPFFCEATVSIPQNKSVVHCMLHLHIMYHLKRYTTHLFCPKCDFWKIPHNT